MKSVLLIGLGRFGKHMAIRLDELGHEVMVVDRDEARVQEVLPFATSAQVGDSTDVDFLSSLGINNFDVCYVAIANDFQSSLETTSLLKELGAQFVVSRAERDVQSKFLLRNGADRVVYPEKQMATWAAVRYTANHIKNFIELDEEYSIFEVSIPEKWLGKSITELDVRKKYKIQIIALKQYGHMVTSLNPDAPLQRTQSLLVIGEYAQLKKVFGI
ncbi:MAG: TrkA family potassium uptake protein [Erysipelotrichaceae bacterium]|nr:TrkA family potassium uptake protein [Erysipelotrichaceae bacterium]